MLKDYNYKVEPTGADSSSQNGGVEQFNQTIGATTWGLLYGSSLPANFWLYAVLGIYQQLFDSKPDKTCTIQGTY